MTVAPAESGNSEVGAAGSHGMWPTGVLPSFLHWSAAGGVNLVSIGPLKCSRGALAYGEGMP
jgi:hypothetical protein